MVPVKFKYYFGAQRPENIFCNGTVLIVVHLIAVLPRRRFTRESHPYPSEKDRPGPGCVVFSLGPVPGARAPNQAASAALVSWP
jgi:hypothetical protein